MYTGITAEALRKKLKKIEDNNVLIEHFKKELFIMEGTRKKEYFKNSSLKAGVK